MKTLRIFAGLLTSLLSTVVATAAPLAYPEVDTFNVRIGTQIFGPEYQFTGENVLIEAADEMLAMGSDTIKFAMGWGARGQYDLVFPSGVTNLARQAELEPVTREVLDMPFRHIFIWAHAMTPSGGVTHWTNGLTATNAQLEYNEMYAFASYLFSTYNGTGKHFYLGHWEGDWWLLPNYDASVNPDPVRIQGMIDWLNIRQQAIDDARAAVAHENVFVYQYTEVNRVRDAMLNGPSNNQRLVNAVLPHVPDMDYVSYSCYDSQGLSESELHATLDYIESNLATAKNARIPGKRVFIGEYGFGKYYDSAAQEPLTRTFIRKMLNWGVPHILFWELYNNEPGRQFWLIDSAGNETPCYDLHLRFANRARLEAGKFFEHNARLPDAAEFAALMSSHLASPLPAPEAFAITQAHAPSDVPDESSVSASIEGGIYGMESPLIRLYWGPVDAGTDPSAWAASLLLGSLNTLQPGHFFTTVDTPAGTTTYYRFRAVNGANDTWAPATGVIRNTRLDPAAFRYRMPVTVSGFNGGEPLADFPLLLELHPGIPDFSYAQFAGPAGGDLRVAAADGVTELPFTVARWDPSGVSKIWIRLPLLDSAADGFILYWGNPAIEAPALSAVEFWSDQALVIDFDDDAAPFADRSGQTLPVVSTVAPQIVPGLNGSAARISSSLTHLRLDGFNPGDRFTLRAWLRPEADSTDIQAIWTNKPKGYTGNGLAWFVNDFNTASGSLILETGDGSNGDKLIGPAGAASRGQWHSVAAVVDRASGSAQLYVDGVLQPATGSLTPNFAIAGTWWLGRFADGGFPFDGLLDELHVDTTTRSPNWITNNHANVADPPAYTAFGDVLAAVPVLRIGMTSGDVVLQWPDHYSDWQLESSSDLYDPASWQEVEASPVARDGLLNLPIDQAAMSYPAFFRLVK